MSMYIGEDEVNISLLLIDEYKERDEYIAEIVRLCNAPTGTKKQLQETRDSLRDYILRFIEISGKLYEHLSYSDAKIYMEIYFNTVDVWGMFHEDVDKRDFLKAFNKQLSHAKFGE